MDELDSQEESLITAEVITPDSDTVVVRLSGELDLSNVAELESEVASALAAGPSQLIVDAAGLEFADSSAIALWLRWSSQVQTFELRDLSPLLRRVLTAMGLDQRLALDT